MKYLSRIKFLPFYAISLLPMWALYMVSDFMYFVVYHLVGYRKKVVFSNLRNSFPTKSDDEIKRIAKDFYRHFCDIVLESFKRLTIGEKTINKRLLIKNPELIQQYVNEDRSILMYTGHQGNWEWLVFLPLIFPYSSNTFYKPIKNKYFEELFKNMRERFGVNCVESDKGFRTIIDNHQKKVLTLNCMIGDQSPTKKSSKYWYNFLNQETAFFVGADKIAKKTDQVVLFPFFKKLKRGYYELEFRIIEDHPQIRNNFEILEKYAQQLEQAIISAPELWLWSHRRWKLKKEDFPIVDTL
ncbi:lysophospholipid acyltransferase family protein [Arenibacter sp. M-2]|uniref:lysophospholipid acyltransferase family protein n=1 Tax=unclassified Arenibacter TaxID=2615047 RepID=UPI000D77222A|nr:MULTISPECIES: lysophospholipid acyltransferase family protein [unclassified Arenibacter]MDL5512080.1 lysophospholipid acyltransferase family protein [Arenibacter sp. M-2]PXX22365.1 KDO2-lipid IV(A) lauroyltransferase [Arenibacter sp. ARW7G5Y1]|tara:strand:- start:39388 stop:40281 length:894 start_codon:yes stop_codon:yes gene_type:complete